MTLPVSSPSAKPAPSQIETRSIIDDYKEQGLFHTPDTPEAKYAATLCLDLATVEPSVAGPERPQDPVRLSEVAVSFKSSYLVRNLEER